MESKELLSSLSEETKKKLTECKTQKEMEALHLETTAMLREIIQ